MKINTVNLGTISYDKALEIQKELLIKRQENKIDNTLLLLEHPHVLTMGKRGNNDNIYLSDQELSRMGIEIYNIDRGGDVTYHGPGQIVGYMIFNVKDVNSSIRLLIQKLQNCFIDLLKDQYGINSYAGTEKHTGIWVDDEKIIAIGLSVKKWVTMHGFAFNVNTDLRYFDMINPCGLSKGVTSIEKLTGKHQDIDMVYKQIGQYISKEFDCELNKIPLCDLL